jgi:hypothetical protein
LRRNCMERILRARLHFSRSADDTEDSQKL